MAARKRKTVEDRPAPEFTVKPIPRALRAALAEIRDDTPNGAMLGALRKAYGVDPTDRATYKAFVGELMRSLSDLATNGRNSKIFDPDFDAFFMMIVRTINSCGEMLELLDKNGIEYRPSWLDDED